MFPFLTAYDPLGNANGSIDPLGALQTYGLLAEMLLPGVTTVTARSRYISMLCAALANADRHRRFLYGAPGLIQRRSAIEPFERMWALACVAARDAGNIDATAGLRGVTYAEAQYQKLTANRDRISLDFQLLKYQARTGGVGTYWTALVGGHLVDAYTGALSAEGKQLAAVFPALPLTDDKCSKLADPASAGNIFLSRNDLMEWGGKCHLAAATEMECQFLAEALTANNRRECISIGLKEMEVTNDLPETWDIRSMKKLRKKVANIPVAVTLGLPTVLDAIVHVERFHEAILCVFDTLLWWGTMHATKQLGELTSDAEFGKKTDQCKTTARNLAEFLNGCSNANVRSAISGMTAFASALYASRSPRESLDCVMQRHRTVQSGKLDGGAQKRDWITLEGRKLLRPSPRFQRTEPPALVSGQTLTHPYRLESFIYMLRESLVLRWTTDEMRHGNQ